MENITKPIIYIDGQNFIYKAAEVLIAEGRISEKQQLHTFSFSHLFGNLMKSDQSEIRYYGTKLRSHRSPPEIAAKSIVTLDSQRKLRNSLARDSVGFIESGKLKLREGDIRKHCGKQDPHFQEKGVDVRLAVDMLKDLYKNKTNTFVVVSSDTDLLPPIREVREMGGKVIYVGFSNKLTKAIIENANETQVIRDSEILEAYDIMNPQTTLDE